MIGSLFAGTNETPGKLIKKNGQLFKSFRGMGSVGAMNKGSADRYFQKKQKDSSKYVPEGVEGFVKYKGCLLYTSPSPRDATLSRMPSSA